MSVELKNWKELCEEKDKRIKELEGKFDEIVERLERKLSDTIFEKATQECNESYVDGLSYGYDDAIEIVKGVMNERD